MRPLPAGNSFVPVPPTVPPSSAPDEPVDGVATSTPGPTPRPCAAVVIVALASARAAGTIYGMGTVACDG